MKRRVGRVSLLGLVIGIIMAAGAMACDTPVYRYAMYRWLPAPYEVYYFHKGDLDDGAEQMRSAIEKAGQSANAPANVVFLSVDLAKDTDLVGVPPDIKKSVAGAETTADPQLLCLFADWRALVCGIAIARRSRSLVAFAGASEGQRGVGRRQGGCLHLADQ